MTVYYYSEAPETTLISYAGLRQPIQEPVPVFPKSEQSAVSPVTFQWESCTDSAPNNIFLDIEDLDREEVIDTLNFHTGVTSTENIELDPGIYRACIGFENSQPYINADGIWITRWKTSTTEWLFSVCEMQLRGDINSDCVVDLQDLDILANQWLDIPGTPTGDIAPLNGDGEVNICDFAVFSAQWLLEAP